MIAHRMHKQLTFDEVQILALQLSLFTTLVQYFCIFGIAAELPDWSSVFIFSNLLGSVH